MCSSRHREAICAAPTHGTAMTLYFSAKNICRIWHDVWSEREMPATNARNNLASDKMYLSDKVTARGVVRGAIGLRVLYRVQYSVLTAGIGRNIAAESNKMLTGDGTLLECIYLRGGDRANRSFQSTNKSSAFGHSTS